ncbi:MAG: hypothetical protein R3F11_02450 [Verrucomicrobiales bacterium]
MKIPRIFSLAAALFAAAAGSAPAAPTAADLRAIGCTVVERDGQIAEIRAEANDFTAAEYRLIGGCASLKKLSLNGKTLTDETLPLLAGLTALEELSTNGSALSDGGYRGFAALKNLRVLHLWHPSWNLPSFTGAGIAHLKALPKLERLTFAGSTAGDAALEAVGQLSQLEHFQTWHTRQTAAGNAHLAKLANLTSLRIGQRLPKGPDSPPSFDGSAIPIFAKLPALEKLEIFEAVLTADDLMPLKEAASLQSLRIHTTEISPEDVEALRKALPGVKIDFDPITAEDRAATLGKKLKLLPAPAAPVPND